METIMTTTRKTCMQATVIRGATAMMMALGLTAVGTIASAEMATRGVPRLDAPLADSSAGVDGNQLRTNTSRNRTSILGGPGYFTAAAGIGFPGGLRTDNSMLNLTGGYNIQYTPDLTGKAFANFNLGVGSDSAYFNDVAVGVNYYPPQAQSGALKPYVAADAGIGFARNDTGQSAASAAVGAGAGFQWLASQTALDVSLRYEVLAAQLQGSTPQLLGLNAGMNF